MEFEKAIQFTAKYPRSSSYLVSARKLITGELQLSVSEEVRTHNLLWIIWTSYYNLIEEFDSSFSEQDRALFEKWDDMYGCGGGQYRGFGSLGSLEDLLLSCVAFTTDIMPVKPEDIGALTDASILGQRPAPRIDDDLYGEPDYLRIWWYEPYAVRSFVEDLIKNNESVWPAAPGM